MPKYIFANGQITIEDGIYTPVDRDTADPHRGVVLMVNRQLMPTLKQTKLSKEQ